MAQFGASGGLVGGALDIPPPTVCRFQTREFRCGPTDRVSASGGRATGRMDAVCYRCSEDCEFPSPKLATAWHNILNKYLFL